MIAPVASHDRDVRHEQSATWHGRAVAEYAAGRPRAAARALDRAERLLADHPTDDAAVRRLRARILLTRALCVFEGSGRAAAEEVLDDAAGVVADDPGDADLRALVWSQRANVRGRRGDLPGAAELLAQAGPHLSALPVLDRTVILINRGLIGCELGRLTSAAADLTAAAELAATHGLGAQRFMALHNLGWVDYLRGDLPRALAAFDRARLADAGVSPAIALLDRGRVMLEAGLIDDAWEVLTRAEGACRQDRLGHAALEVRHELARAAWLAGRPDAARLVTGGRRQATRRGAPVWQARLDLLAVRLAPGPTTRRRVSALAAAEADAPGDPTLRIEYAVLAAEAALHDGDRAAAGRLLATATATATAARHPPSLSGRLDLHRVRALHRIAADDRPGARRELRRAAAVLDRADVATASIDLRTARQLHGRALAELDLDLAVRQGAAAALRAIERWRARTLRVPRTRPDPDPEVAGRLAEVRRLSERVRAGAGDRADADRIRRLSELAEGRRRAADAARARRPGVAPGGPAVRVDAVIGPGALRAAAAATDATVISYARVGGRLVGVAVDARRQWLVDLGPLTTVAEAARRLRADLRMSVRPLPAPLRDGVAASMAATAAELGRRIVAPFAVRSTRLVVIGSRELTGLPWSMICPDRPVTVALSATVWARGLSRTRASGGPMSYAVVTGPGVAQAAAEHRAVRAAWGRDAELVVPGTGAGLAAGLADARLVHVAAHGRHHQHNPMFSAIDLADGPAHLYDLEQVAVGAEAVVLAACDVGRARVRPGDEPLGLCAGLLLLGVTSVIAPVAAVPDAPTAALMGELHRRLAAGDPGDVALVEAGRAVARRGSGAAADADPDADPGRAFVQTGTAW